MNIFELKSAYNYVLSNNLLPILNIEDPLDKKEYSFLIGPKSIINLKFKPQGISFSYTINGELFHADYKLENIVSITAEEVGDYYE